MTRERAAALGVELCSLDEIWPRADAITGTSSPSIHATRTALSVWTLDQGILEPVLEAVRRSPNAERALALQL
jgi:hypothetical protein